MTQTVGDHHHEFAQTGGDKLRAIIAARREGRRIHHQESR